MKSNNASHSINPDFVCTREDRKKNGKTQLDIYVRVQCGKNEGATESRDLF